jgi:hypothetical protein
MTDLSRASLPSSRRRRSLCLRRVFDLSIVLFGSLFFWAAVVCLAIRAWQLSG